MRRFIFIFAGLCAGLILLPAQQALAATSSALSVVPDSISINTFFSGHQVTISGEIPDGSDVVIEVTGPKANEAFDMKGRFGPFWMTREQVHLENAPKLYALLLPLGEDWVHVSSTLGLGVENLRHVLTIHVDQTPADDIFQMFLDLKHSEKLYVEAPGVILYTPDTEGRKRFTADYRFPAATSIGLYTIQASVIEKGRVSRKMSRDLNVAEVGFIKMVNNLASNDRLLYGIAAVLIALFAGAFMGLIFKRGGGH